MLAIFLHPGVCVSATVHENTHVNTSIHTHRTSSEAALQHVLVASSSQLMTYEKIHGIPFVREIENFDVFLKH